MRISRFKAIPFLAAVVFMLLLALQQTSKTIGVINSPDNKVVISGALNNAASLAGIPLFGGILILFLIGFISGRTLAWVPKIVFMIIGGMTIMAFIIGLGVNTAFKSELKNNGYVECTSKRELTLKYSSRTYVLDPSRCEEDE
ncbi:hypothetical protein L1D52_02790 [Vibrio brasiliensis]|uniref:hypothetical protein n=1 Tax=Vibrio brasiliensis TaxID=170652 RepID=UPI001EFCC322|nr:hypothetical protein [Vibrio brasiliensis]MCG9781272.1 hypothetical protein [Vibrio brasiliensis]